MKKHGEYIELYFDEANDHPHYVRGHVSKDEAQEVLTEYFKAQNTKVTVKSIKHAYARLVRVGPNHADAIEGLDTTFRVIDEPRPTYYAVTECEHELKG